MGVDFGDVRCPICGDCYVRASKPNPPYRLVDGQWIEAGEPLTPAKPDDAGAVEKAVEAEQCRWQERIDATLAKYDTDNERDGSGCDSGDPLDFTDSEICQVLNQQSAALAEARREIQSLKDELLRVKGFGHKIKSHVEGACEVLDTISDDGKSATVKSTPPASPGVEEIEKLILDYGLAIAFQHPQATVDEARNTAYAAVRQLAADNEILFDLRKMTLAERDAVREELAALKAASDRNVVHAVGGKLTAQQAAEIAAMSEAMDAEAATDDGLEKLLANLKAYPNTNWPEMDAIRAAWNALGLKHDNAIEEFRLLTIDRDAERQKVERLREALRHIVSGNIGSIASFQSFAAAALRDTE